MGAEVEAEEKQAEVVSWPKNANLGRFTNFVNLMDLAAIAVPSGVLHCEEPSAASDPTGTLTCWGGSQEARMHPVPSLSPKNLHIRDMEG